MKEDVTFGQLLKKTERKNRNALMHRAHVANRLAKSVRGRSRSSSYSVKARALQAIIDKFPNEVEVYDDAMLPDMIVVRVAQTKFGLHAPRNVIRLS